MFFLNLKAFDQVLVDKSLNSEYRNKVKVNLKNENRIYLSQNINPYFYHLVENLDKNFKLEYLFSLNTLDGFNFDFVASSLRLIYNIHLNKQEFLNSFYKSFFEFYSNIKPIDLLHFRKPILFLLEKLIELNFNSIIFVHFI